MILVIAAFLVDLIVHLALRRLSSRFRQKKPEQRRERGPKFGRK